MKKTLQRWGDPTSKAPAAITTSRSTVHCTEGCSGSFRPQVFLVKVTIQWFLCYVLHSWSSSSLQLNTCNIATFIHVYIHMYNHVHMYSICKRNMHVRLSTDICNMYMCKWMKYIKGIYIWLYNFGYVCIQCRCTKMQMYSKMYAYTYMSII